MSVIDPEAEAEMSARFFFTLLPGLIAFVAIGCGSESSPPTAPTPPSSAVAPAPTPTPTPPARGRVEMSVVPNPVPYSGDRIADVPGCVTSQNTWFYDQILTETGGSMVTFTQRIDLFDNSRTNDRSDLKIELPANGSITLRTRWCSATSVEHTAESRFSGKDAAGNEITVTSGVVRLMKKPS
jgi:hypothetical protein